MLLFTVPSSVAEIVSGVRTSQYTLEVQFVPISKEDNTRNEISTYIVTYSPSINSSCFNTSANNELNVSVPVDSTTAMIDSLEASQEYCVAVAASSEAGTGNFSQTLLVTSMCTVSTVGLHECCNVFFHGYCPTGYYSTLVQMELIGEITCNVYFVS